MSIVFFDIDGTLWDRNMTIPERTKKAIRELKEHGVYTFLNSGRARAFIQNPRLLELGFDGIVSGCGTSVNFRGKELVYHKISPEVLDKTLRILKKYDMPVILEGRDFQYVDESDFAKDPFLDMLKREIGQSLLGISDNPMKWEASKFSAVILHENYKEALAELSPWYQFLVHEERVVEGVPKGFSKATGIRAVCEYLNIAREDTYAFGDSVNDLDMLRYAGYGIAMGNGSPEAKEAADYVTDDIHGDGIYNACKHFLLI